MKRFENGGKVKEDHDLVELTQYSNPYTGMPQECLAIGLPDAPYTITDIIHKPHQLTISELIELIRKQSREN